MPTDGYGSIEKEKRFDFDPGNLNGLFNDFQNLVPGDQPQRKTVDFDLILLLLRIDIGYAIVHEIFFVRGMVPQILPFIGVSAQPVPHKNCPFRRMLTDIGDQFRALVVMEMGQCAV